MKLKIFTLTFSDSKNGFDDHAIQDFQSDREIIEVTEHFFVHEQTPYLTVLLSAEPPVFVLWYEFTKWLLAKTENFPKRVRFTLSQRIENLALDITQDLTIARYARHKARLLADINAKLDQLRILLRLCHDMEILDHKGYRYASAKIDETGSQTSSTVMS